MSTLDRVCRPCLPCLIVLSLAACSTRDAAPPADTAVAAANAPSTPSTPSTPSAPNATASAAPAADSIVRGSVVTVSDTALSVGMAGGGDVHVALVPPVKVFQRQNADLSRVTEHTFVGVTSVPAPGGGQRATEIHIFPEELRGLGEGSRPMAPQAGAGGGGQRTMTNGTIAGGASGGSRMTNGAVSAQAGGTITVNYNGGTQTITVPKDVPVTAIAPTTAPLTPGTNVIVLATKRADGSLQASRVMLATPAKR